MDNHRDQLVSDPWYCTDDQCSSDRHWNIAMPFPAPCQQCKMTGRIDLVHSCSEWNSSHRIGTGWMFWKVGRKVESTVSKYKNLCPKNKSQNMSIKTLIQKLMHQFDTLETCVSELECIKTCVSELESMKTFAVLTRKLAEKRSLSTVVHMFSSRISWNKKAISIHRFDHSYGPDTVWLSN